MSVKLRNEQRNGFMRNFSKFVIERYIIIDDDSLNDNEKDLFVSEINEALWLAIQETNMYAQNRILPFVLVRRVVEVNDELRIIINDIDSDRKFDDYENENREKIDIKQLSHLINFKTISPRRQIQVSDHLIPGNAKMIVSHSNQVAAAVDIFLDIAMFNSIGFLKELDIEHKRDFSELKYRFAKEQNLSSYYKCCENNPPSYWSFAFSARIDTKNIDYFKYVSLWDMFLKTTYPKKTYDKSPLVPPYKQMEYHKDRENFEKVYFTKEYWTEYAHGDYLIIRINREPNDNERKLLIINLFGIPKFHIGAVKVIPANDYFKQFIYKQMEELYISAYKIVV